jgi:hypothetical protein
MAVTKVVVKTGVKAATKNVEAEQVAQAAKQQEDLTLMRQSIEVYGTLMDEVAKIKPTMDKADIVKKELLAFADELFDPADKPTVTSDHYVLSIGQKGNMSELVPNGAAMVLEKLQKQHDPKEGLAIFLQLVSITMTDLKKYFTEVELASLLKTERRKARTLSVSPKL